MVIRPELNSYIVVHVPPEKPGGREGDIDGRVHELVEGHPIAMTPGRGRNRDCLFTHAGVWYLKPRNGDHWVLPGARLVHCHHQPPEADDSEAWVLVRHAIRRAMRRTPKPSAAQAATRFRRPPKESA